MKSDYSSFFCLFNGDRDSYGTKWVRHIAILVHLEVLDFLEHATGTAVSDHFGLIVLAETDQKIAGRAACDAV